MDTILYFCAALLLIATVVATIKCLESAKHTTEIEGTTIIGGDTIFANRELRRDRRRRHPHTPLTPPPEFNSAILNSSPVFYIQMEDPPPPSYTDYLEMMGEEKKLPKQADPFEIYV